MKDKHAKYSSGCGREIEMNRRNPSYVDRSRERVIVWNGMNNKPKLQNKGKMQCVFQQIPTTQRTFFLFFSLM